MDIILTSKQVNVKQGMDLVELHLGDRSVILYYQTVFDICMKIHGLSTFALRYERNSPVLMQELEKYDLEPIDEPLSPVYRRSGLDTNVKRWRVGYENQLVMLQFDDLIVKMHYVDAVLVHAWLGRAAKQAKRWAGDSGRQFRVFAKLTDAEDNDKFAFG